MSDIVGSISARRYEAVKDQAHALKGGAASVGATELTQFVKRLEKATHESLRLRAAQWIEELQQTSSRALMQLDQHIKQRDVERALPNGGR